MSTEIKASPFEFKIKEEGDGIHIEGYGSTFGGKPDFDGDVITKGAFAASIKQKLPKMLYQHDRTQIAGKWNDATEDNHGLFLKGIFLNTPLGQQAREEARSGALDSLSIGYRVNDFSFDPATGIRTLKDLDLFEVSLVTFPANPDAVITGAKSMPKTIREFEERLGELGFSKNAAELISTRGFKAWLDRGEPDDFAGLSKALIDLTRNLKDVYVQ